MISGFIFSFLIWLIGLCVGSPMNMEASKVRIVPYTFTMDQETHMLHTTWEVAGDMSISSVCAYATVTMMEMSWTGEAEVDIITVFLLCFKY